MKKCSSCKEVKPFDGFYRNRSVRGGLKSQCKECEGQWKRSPAGRESIRRYKTGESGRLARKRYEASESWKAVLMRAHKKHRKKYPDRSQAKRAVEFAVKRGSLPKASSLPCFYVSCDKLAHGYHHYSYDPSHQLDVTPYCGEHHRIMDFVDGGR